MNTNALTATVQALLANGKGILAADESFGTIEKRFVSLGIASTEENRRAYRQMLFSTPKLGDSISGVILFDETIRQKSDDGTPLVKLLEKTGIVPGIKVDAGTVNLPKFPEEKFTQGLDGLGKRLADYRSLGARFAKWRAVVKIGEKIPSLAAIETNAVSLALYAGLCQAADLVPIVEPEVLMDGNHSLERCEEVTRWTLETVFAALAQHRVELERLILKINMVLPGEDASAPADDAVVSEVTLRCLRRAVPAAVPGIVFLSGGQNDIDATRRLNALNQSKDLPWRLTFSYGRALQDASMKAWHGQRSQLEAGQRALFQRAKANGLAALGRYTPAFENAEP